MSAVVPATFKLISLQNPVFACYVNWTVLLLLKTMFLSIYTAYVRLKKQTFANPEDGPDGRRNVRFNDDDVERVRRAHRNDLENLFPGIIIGFLYVLVDPPTLSTCVLFRAAATARIIHTYVYVKAVPQPARVLCFSTYFMCTVYMAVAILMRVM
ncbi:microsomal glutathione S-transferase 1-like [Contarinia nasturtii]|uniref:microsomal glutathione S-transferase 1-like n=1 Tax=Contarinia nasturtii TaxID=265458 RepID=UPI0012D465C1|nr:microsomal glutathione S-transferase 1-like [Contarinia nasturtii]